MRGDILFIGVFMQVVNLILLATFFIPWTMDLIVKVILGSIYGLFNILSIILVILGIAMKESK